MVNWIRRITQTSSAAIWLAIGLLAIATAMVMPNYFTGQWAWSQAPTLSGLKVLKTFQNEGLSLSGWQVVDQQTIELGHKSWSVQALTLRGEAPSEDSNASSSSKTDAVLTSGLDQLPPHMAERLQEEPIYIFLRPQSDAKDEPLVEWIDFNGLQRWTTDQQKSVHLTLNQAPIDDAAGAPTLDTRYFRGWNQNHTYAVMQWYAWPNGGSPKISDWFWADQWMQWHHHQRMPWVGVTLLVPMKPLGDISTNQPGVEAIAQSIQSTLVQDITTAMVLPS